MKSRSRSKRRSNPKSRASLLGYCMVGASLLASGLPGKAADEEAKPDDAQAKTEETKTEETKPALTPEEMFEGGSKTYKNWIEFSYGGFLTHGNKAEAEEQLRRSDGMFGGIEDFHYQADLGKDTTLKADGRALFDQHDYALKLNITRPQTGFFRFNYEQFRTWYNGDGGDYLPGNVDYPLSSDALGVDRGEISVEAGLTLEKYPKITFKYTHLFRDGQKGSTSWGQTHPTLTTLTRALGPAIYDLDEQRDIFQLDATHHIKKTDFGVGLRYETADLNDARKVTQAIGEPVQRRITTREGTSYDSFSVHAYTETWFKNNLFLSTGYLFSQLDTDLSGSRIYGSDYDVSYLPNILNGPGYYDLSGGLQQHEYVFDINLMSTPAKNLTLTPSFRVQKEDWSGDSTALLTLGNNAPPLASNVSHRDAVDVRERLDLRYTGVTNWVLYARGEWTEGDGKLQEDGNLGQTPLIRRNTEDHRLFQKYTAGARWYPDYRVAVDFQAYYKNNDLDYDHLLDNTSNAGTSGNRYPAYFTMLGFETYDGNVRLTLRPTPKISLVSRYEYQLSTIRTQPDPVSGLAEIESSRMTRHVFAQNVSWVPWSRLSLQAGFNYVISETKTPVSDYTQAILKAQNNYWTVNCNSGLVLDDRTDLNVGYFYYESDNFQDNSTVGLPLGASAREHGVTATLVRRLRDNLRLTLRYGYFHFLDGTFGGSRDYEAHALFSSLQWRF